MHEFPIMYVCVEYHPGFKSCFHASWPGRFKWTINTLLHKRIIDIITKGFKYGLFLVSNNEIINKYLLITLSRNNKWHWRRQVCLPRRPEFKEKWLHPTPGSSRGEALQLILRFFIDRFWIHVSTKSLIKMKLNIDDLKHIYFLPGTLGISSRNQKFFHADLDIFGKTITTLLYKCIYIVLKGSAFAFQAWIVFCF
jgi:hypothetical protein